MTIRKLLSRKGAFVPTIRPDALVADAIEQLELDDAGALVVTDDGRSILFSVPTASSLLSDRQGYLA